MKNKKAQGLGKLMESIFLLIIIGFVAAGGVLGLTEFGNSPSVLDSFSVNEENSTVSGGRIGFDFGSFPYRLTSVSQVGNASLIANFGVTVNCTLGDGGFCFVNSSYTNGNSFNLTYTYDANTVAANITRNSETGVLNVTTLFGVIGVLLGVGALLIVVLSFAPGTRLGRD